MTSASMHVGIAGSRRKCPLAIIAMFALHRRGIRPRGSWRADRRPLGAQTAMSQTVETFCLVFCGAQIIGIRRLANRFLRQDGPALSGEARATAMRCSGQVWPD